MSKVRADKLVDRAGTGAPELTQGATVPSGKYISGAGGVNLTGILTATTIDASGAYGISTATGVPGVNTGGHTVLSTVNISGVSTFATGKITTVNVGAGITLTASGIINSGFTTITGATETVTGVTTYPTPDSSSTKVTIECDASKGTLFSHDMSNGNVGIVSLTNIPVRGNSFTTFSIIFTQLSSTPVGTGNTLAKNGIGTNVYLDGGFTGFTTSARVATATTVTLSEVASDHNIVTLGVHYNGGATGTKANFTTFATGQGGFRLGYWGP